mmetsp:Transcript_24370/g.28624  ORF Transcript_24370/g.28624 Transcript_24370/m.28624 type:complete len:179 (-) Transcript_24370:44-580(-)
MVVAVWSTVYLSDSLSMKTCYVKENADGSFVMVNYVDDGIVIDDNITNVSNRFEYLTVSYLAQGVLSLIAVTYQLMSIYCISSLLMYRHFISRINKLFLLYGAYILVMTHLYRLDEPGQICSGDYLSEEERNDPLIAKNYLLETGKILWVYLVFIWFITTMAILGSSIIGYQVYTTFA